MIDTQSTAATHALYNFNVRKIDGSSQSLSDYRGQVLLIVNVASRCGFTPQYQGLETLYKKYKERGFSILGFPCNQFGAQEPGTEEEIKSFCDLNYQITFPLFAKVDVNGTQADPLYTYLKKAAPGIMGTEAIKWNFTKFLVDRSGEIVQRYAPTTTPESLEGDILRVL